ncbi:hypothetical protein HPB47_021345 [Ixodes persulcatus]|uniref:Uncharacterized protein n=1 Tax=Ixodes persulcatus TaxID=34615 RepID=A0AC60QCZ7_IXOPE|nr:hypothetical protein HPB47_021345 [Ixodes persulcatus]
MKVPIQRQFVSELTMELLSTNETSDFDACEEGHTSELVLKNLFWCSTNIVLKNYRGEKRQLPPLPIEDYKVVVRPLDGLDLGAWGPDQVYRVIKLAAKLTPADTAEIKTRLHKDQNLAVLSTPSVDTLERLCNISSIALGEKQFRVKSYAAMPDDSCKGVISGLTSRPSSEWLNEELNAWNSNCIVLNARTMGSTTSAIITFHGCRVPRLVYIDGGEFECRVYRPKKQVCTKCLRLGHR